MEILDKDFKNDFLSAFKYAVKVVSYYLHVSFLETCKSYGLCPTGLSIRKKSFIEFESDELKMFRKETIVNTENDLLEALCVGICERMFNIEKTVWDELYQLEKNNENVNFKEWLVKLLIHLEKKMKKIIKIKRKKLRKLSVEGDIKELVSERFTEHLSLFNFFDNFSKYCEAFSPDITNIANLVTLGNSFDDPKNISNVFADFDKVTLEETRNHPSLEKPSNVATLLDGRYEGKFVGPNVINLSKHHLPQDEISLLSKGLKFIPTPKQINKARIKEELETYGRKLRLMWHYRNEEGEIIINPFKKKSKFNPKQKDVKSFGRGIFEELFESDKGERACSIFS